MLDRVDRVLLAVRDRNAAADTFGGALGAQRVREDAVPCYAANRVVVQAGESQFELLEPAGEGAVSQHLERWGEGIFAAGFSTSDLGSVARSMEDAGMHFSEEGTQVFIEPDQTRGMRTALQLGETRDRVGDISFLYEVTNIVADHEEAASFYARAFGLEQSRFCPIKSKEYGYTGTLTLFNPPQRLDRVEITQITEPSRAMGRFFARRGPSLYMCFVEAPDLRAVAERLDKREARYAWASDYPNASLFIHPSSLHGMLMGVSGPLQAWRWSGHPELVPGG